LAWSFADIFICVFETLSRNFNRTVSVRFQIQTTMLLIVGTVANGAVSLQAKSGRKRFGLICALAAPSNAFKDASCAAIKRSAAESSTPTVQIVVGGMRQARSLVASSLVLPGQKFVEGVNKLRTS
jgi:hypothetical protein